MTSLMFFVLMLTSIFVAVFLFLNYQALRRSNRLVVARRYSDVSRILSDELTIRTQIIELFKRRKSQDRQELTGLARETVDEQNDRIQKIVLLQKQIESKFSDLDDEEPIDVEKQVMVARNNKKYAEMTLKRFELPAE
ncbi:MAG: hypothetical protein AB8D52_11930 [Gammaproteobacteria bacterium]